MFPPAPFAPGEIYGKGVPFVDTTSRILEIVSAIRPIPACKARVTQRLLTLRQTEYILNIQ